MRIKRFNGELSILLNNKLESQNDLGWEDSFSLYEEDLINQIINPIENYETIRYIHEPYAGMTEDQNDKQTDIWFYFYFIDNQNYVQNYLPTGLSNQSNSQLTKQTTNSYFRIELYKTQNQEPPSRANRKLVLTKNLLIPSGEKFYLTANKFNDYIFAPVFYGSNYHNRENMYFFWFQDETPYDTTTYTGSTFWMTAKYFNSVDGSIYDFVNDCFPTTHEVNETEDMYYKFVINMTNYTYVVYEYDGVQGNRVGTTDKPIKFYQKGGANC
jgi:hypothetical protein